MRLFRIVHTLVTRRLAILLLLLQCGVAARVAAEPIVFPPPSTPCPKGTSCPGMPPPLSCPAPSAGATCETAGPASQGGGGGINLGVGNPINVITGNKYQREDDLPALPGVLGLEIVRHYNSVFSLPHHSNGILGRGWKLSYETELFAAGRTIQIVEAHGSRIIFNIDPANPSLCASNNPADGTVTVGRGEGGTAYVWRWTTGRELLFNSKGKLVRITAPTGETVQLAYKHKGMLTDVTDPQGRSLHLTYLEGARAQSGDAFRGVQRIESPVGKFAYAYGSSLPAGATIAPDLVLANLVRVEFPPSASGAKPGSPGTERIYHYEDRAFPTLLSGITLAGAGSDGIVLKRRLATYLYNRDGKAVLTVKGLPARLQTGADGRPLLPARLVPGSGIEQVTVEYGVSGQSTIRNSLGQTTVYRHAILAGQHRLLEVRGPGCASCGETNVRYGYDTLGRVKEVTRLSIAGVALEAELTERDVLGRLARSGILRYSKGKAGKVEWQRRAEYEGSSVRPARIVMPSIVAGRDHVVAIDYGSGASAGLPVRITETGFAPGFNQANAPIALARSVSYRYNARGQRTYADGPLDNAASAAGPANSDISLTSYDAGTGLLSQNIAPGNTITAIAARDAALRPTLIRNSDSATVQTTAIINNWRGQPEEIRVTAVLADGSGKALTRVLGYRYDAAGNVSSITQPDGLTTRFAYDAAGRLLSRTLPDASVVLTERDTEGRMRTAALAFDQAQQLRQKEFAAPLPHADYSYDEAGQLRELRDGLGSIKQMDYDAAGKLSTVTDALGMVTRFVYNADGLLQERTAAAGTPDAAVLRLGYDTRGRTDLLVDPNGVGTALRFDDFGRKILEVNPDRGVTTFAYDAAGNLVGRTQQNGGTTRFAYDQAQHLVAVGNPAAPNLMQYRYRGRFMVEFTASVDGSAAQVTERTQLAYDAFGQVLEERKQVARVDQAAAPAGVAATAARGMLSFVTTSAYDAAGRLVLQTLPDGHRLRYLFDGPDGARPGQLSAVLFDDTVVVDGIEQSSAGGLATYVTGSGIRQRLRRDVRGRLARLDAATDPDADPSWWRRTMRRLGIGAAVPVRTVYSQSNEYDAAGRVSAIERRIDGVTPQATERYAYDRLAHLTGTPDGEGGYTRFAYDKGGNRLSETHADLPAQLRESASVLASAAVPARLGYHYAAGTNRLLALTGEGSGGIDAGAQPGRAGYALRTLWVYHPTGVPLAQFELPGQSGGALRSSPGASRRIVYNDARRPVAVIGSDNQLLARYYYNGAGERFAKTVYAATPGLPGPVYRTAISAPGPTRGATMYSLYQQRRLAAEADQDGRILNYYVYLDGKPVAKIQMEEAPSSAWQSFTGLFARSGSDRSMRVYAIHTDHLGTPQVVTDPQQQVVWRASTTPFGETTVYQAATRSGRSGAFEMNLRLPGQVHDAETGLSQNYYRDYDPRLGRYTTPDPLGLEGGVNPYLYVDANPLANSDALGLYQSDIHYYMTFFLALAAGVDYKDARTIALATQYVDSNPLTTPINVNEVGEPQYIKSLWTNAERLKLYHFTLSDTTTGKTLSNFKNTDLLGSDPANDSAQLKNLMNAASKAPTTCASMQFFGEYLHSFEDTFSHRDANNMPFDAVWSDPLNIKQLGIGHGLYNSNPDYTYHVQNGCGIFKNCYDWKNNPSRTLAMEKAVYEKMDSVKGSGKVIPWEQVEQVVAAFNNIPENEENSADFRKKLDLLQDVLKIWGYQAGGAENVPRDIKLGLGSLDGYDKKIGAENREKNLCDKNGIRLVQADYVGTLLPSTPCPAKAVN